MELRAFTTGKGNQFPFLSRCVDLSTGQRLYSIPISFSSLHLNDTVCFPCWALIISKAQKLQPKQHKSPFCIQHCSLPHQPPVGACAIAVASAADNPVLKLSGALVKLLPLNLEVTGLQGGEHDALFPMLEKGVHQILNEVNFRAQVPNPGPQHHV